MILEMYDKEDPKKRIAAEDFEQVLQRQHIYKMPLEFRIIFRTRIFQQRFIKKKAKDIPLEVVVVLENGHEIDMTLLRTENRGELTMFSLVHKDVFKLMRNVMENKETIFDIEFDDYVTNDTNTWWYFRDKLAKQGLILKVKDTLDEYEQVHGTSWEGKEVKTIHSVFRETDIEMKEVNQKYSVYNTKEDYYSTELGDAREILDIRITKDDVDGLKVRLLPTLSVIAVMENAHLEIMDKVKMGDIEYCLMGLQRNWKDSNITTHMILGLMPNV
jgi:hypothetical protein